jgi:hypothetical protein
MDNQIRKQKLDQLEQDAREAGRMVYGNRLDERVKVSEDAQIAFASALAQLYIQKHVDIESLETSDLTLFMMTYVPLFRKGYEEVTRKSPQEHIDDLKRRVELQNQRGM